MNLALPLIEAAGEASFDEIMMPLSPVYAALEEVPAAR